MTKPGLRLTFFIALGLILVWLIISHSFAAYFARSAPELALSLNPSQPKALAKLLTSRLIQQSDNAANREEKGSEALESGRLSDFAADRPLGHSDKGSGNDAEVGAGLADAGVRKEIRSLAERTLAADPLNSRAFYVLGEIAAAENDEASASAFMRAAIRRSFRETGATYYMLIRSFTDRNYAEVLDHADAILRTSPQLARHIVPLLARIAEEEDARGFLDARLATDPPWRRAFLSSLPNAVTDARTPFNILLALRDTPNPPSAADLKSYLEFLIAKGFYELAYYVWLQFLTSEDLSSTGLLFNGSFERPISGLPFDWIIRPGPGVTIQISPAAGLERGRALQIEFGHGRVEFGSVSQTTLLAPGRYRFTGYLRGELAGRRGLVWRITCAGQSNRILGESEMAMGLAPNWRAFSFSFEVPEDQACRAQVARLTLDARSASERFVSGAIWYGNLKIERMTGSS